MRLSLKEQDKIIVDGVDEDIFEGLVLQLLFVQLEQEREVHGLYADGRVLLVEVGDIEDLENERQYRDEYSGRIREHCERVYAMKSQWVVSRCWDQSYNNNPNRNKKT